MTEKEVRLIDVRQLYSCRTCRHHGHCDFIVTCDHGEMYSPDMSKLETIDPESLRPHGKWIESLVLRTDMSALYEYTCSECAILSNRESKFCPNRGAIMVKDEDDFDEDDFDEDDFDLEAALEADRCYECGAYGDDYSTDENGEMVCNCDRCPYNSMNKED